MNTEIEIRILQMIEEIVMKSISLDDLLLETNFIDSISAVDLALRIEEEFHCAIPPQEITEHMKTARSLATYVIQNQ